MKGIYPIILGMNPPNKLIDFGRVNNHGENNGLDIIARYADYEDGVKPGEVITGRENVLSERSACMWIHFVTLDMARKFANTLLDSIETMEKRDKAKEDLADENA